MSERTTGNRPVIVVHLEDPPGSGLAACSGDTIARVGIDGWPSTPRQLCTGCHRSVITTGDGDRDGK